MKILALNCGSSSIKAALFARSPLERVSGIDAVQIGTPQAALRIAGREVPLAGANDLTSAADALLARLDLGADELSAVVHRIVHGGERFTQPTLLDDRVVAALDALGPLAPLHNPPALAVVARSRQVFATVPQFAVFDTAFHSTLPPRARHYALPSAVRAKLGIRRYGFHGISHASVAKRVAVQMRVTAQALRIVSCHLGNGASVAAVEYGRSVETSMGMTPLEGLVMGSRAGDLDPGVVLELARSHDRDTLERLLSHEAGLVGLTGTNDMRSIEARAAEGDEECRLAINVYAHRIRKYIGAYAAVMGGVDVIAFTGGVGENSALVRHRCLQRLDFLGARLDEDRNRDALRTPAAACEDVAEPGSRVRLFVLRAAEEFAMAEAIAPLLAKRAVATTDYRIPIAVSARHAHLSQRTLERLFGPGFELKPGKALSQTGQFSAAETVSLIGPRGRLERVRLMGPPREHDQIEISRSDEFALGVDAPVRISGNLANTPGITVEGPAGRVTLASGLIAARRHIHMSVQDAARLRLRDCDTVDVRIDSDGRDLTFNDVTVRVDASYTLELHLDTDEANAAAVRQGDYAELVPPP